MAQAALCQSDPRIRSIARVSPVDALPRSARRDALAPKSLRGELRDVPRLQPGAAQQDASADLHRLVDRTDLLYTDSRVQVSHRRRRAYTQTEIANSKLRTAY